MKQAADDYHRRSNEEDRANASFVLGYNPDTGDIKGAAATVGVGLVNKLRGGVFRVGVGITIAGRAAIAMAHSFGFEIGSWQGYKRDVADCERRARMP